MVTIVAQHCRFEASLRPICAIFFAALFVLFALCHAGRALADDKTAKPTDAAAEPDNAKQVAIKAAGALYDGIRTETLPNGLRVFLKPISRFAGRYYDRDL